PSGLPGAPPFVRGTDGHIARPGWDIRQRHTQGDPEQAAEAIRADLEGGAASVLLTIGGHHRDGIHITTLEDLKRCIAPLDLNQTPLGLDAGAQGPALLAALVVAAEDQGVSLDALRGHLHLDPLDSLARTGALPNTLETTWDQTADAVAWCQENASGLRPLMVNGAPYHGAGATEAQDVAFLISSAVEVLRALEKRGVEPGLAAANLSFSVSLGCDFLLGIAKLRALRWLWSRVGEVSGFTASMDLHVAPSERILTQRDPWVNILRGTAVGLAGAIGGADHIHIAPFDQAIGQPEDLGRRVARNTQTVLMHEAHLGWVMDPAGGSFALETLTRELGERAWTIVGEVETAGGMAAALLDGTISRWIEDKSDARQRSVARRTTPITGVSSFPMLDEERLERPSDGSRSTQGAAPPGSLPKPGDGRFTQALVDTARDAGLTAAVTALASQTPTTMAPLPLRRLAAPYEALRDQSDAWLASRGIRPRVFLANLGSLAAHTPRASFVRNLLAAGGLEAVGEAGFETPEGIPEAFKSSGAEVAFICGAHQDYERLAVDTARALRGAGARGLWLAGDPRALKEALADEGLT
ncbi:MAG: methylmalonyl-CoA mutase family protein, partial [Myxococcota bacterium]|nr:methylmalonyl-CoA mutase family protein [Myxococcota bacterium]